LNNFDTISSSVDEEPISSPLDEETTDTTSEPASVVPAPENVGGMTLKKRAPSDKPVAVKPAKAGAAGRPATLTPRPGGAPSAAPKASKRMERFSRVLPSRDPGVRMNEQIRATEVRVIGSDGDMIGVMSPKEGIEIARAKQMDLIEIVPNAKPPVCKIIEFGKWKYEQQKKDKLAKKSSHQQLLKEVRFHPHTDTHDFEFKVRHARNFIEEGHKVKAYVQFKGREVAYKQFGEELLNNFKARMEDIAKVDQEMSMMGRMMSMVLSPGSKKKVAQDSNKKEEKPSMLKPKLAKKANTEVTAEELGPDFTESIIDEEATETAETSDTEQK
jgi:translation initiation factor IF-3